MDIGKNKFGELLTFLREQKDLTLRELVRRIGASAPFLSNVEKGRWAANWLFFRASVAWRSFFSIRRLSEYDSSTANAVSSEQAHHRNKNSDDWKSVPDRCDGSVQLCCYAKECAGGSVFVLSHSQGRICQEYVHFWVGRNS